MQYDDIGSGKQFLLRHLLDIGGHLFVDRSALCQDPASECMEKLRCAAADLTKADDADRLALQFPSDKSVLGLSVAASPLDFAHVACQ